MMSGDGKLHSLDEQKGSLSDHAVRLLEQLKGMGRSRFLHELVELNDPVDSNVVKEFLIPLDRTLTKDAPPLLCGEFTCQLFDDLLELFTARQIGVRTVSRPELLILTSSVGWPKLPLLCKDSQLRSRKQHFVLLSLAFGFQSGTGYWTKLANDQCRFDWSTTGDRANFDRVVAQRESDRKAATASDRKGDERASDRKADEPAPALQDTNAF
jgi:hypothetical protein